MLDKGIMWTFSAIAVWSVVGIIQLLAEFNNIVLPLMR